MKFAEYIPFIVFACMYSLLLEAEFKKPRMPRGVTAEKMGVPQKPPAHREEQVRHFKKKRKGLQGKKKRYTFSNMNLEELRIAKNKSVISKNYVTACKYLERMIILCDNINEKADIIIELADLLFSQKSFDDAAKWYNEFTQLYPGNKQVEYASYRAIVCYSKKILGPDRDQTPTEKTLELAETFLKRADIFVGYKQEVLQIQKECQQRIAESECRVVAFFIKVKEYDQAQKRIENIRADWGEKLPEAKLELARLEVNLADRCPAFKAPESSIKLAQATRPDTKKIDMAARF